jgi:hypothetical protein
MSGECQNIGFANIADIDDGEKNREYEGNLKAQVRLL